ncbi:uncharacterized protein PGTG_12679 [Puccinia graminis f. sp. tritici CRL 75-36-700-3]|uniref:Uncharacterized protein n=1 Tax=Puccinia graminis f. sp. tritici (strain CRL 75-36-700-3 / race SCCL) TaxID=418459 RepID=E3KRL3_PUCGT|nr:uncharacterized protein PGTG_12679 [Puccinia graminis f. sp. tritici CRL 75-36-700-3]EFP86938.2 hypothetical protein PGTG_12679 [Puccinia graminis f. sp. tritici CRL 75-36-700-3]
MADKTSVVGLGIVMSKREVADPEASTSSKNLVIVLQHTDYDPVAKAQVQFNTQYIIGGRKNLANTFGLFQLGREILISGHITGYEHAQFMWIAISVSVTVGHQSVNSQALITSQVGEAKPRRPGLISVGEDLSQPQAEVIVDTQILGSSSGTVEGLDVGPVHNEGQNSSNSVNYYDNVALTSGKKRTKKEILADAKRAKLNMSSV